MANLSLFQQRNTIFPTEQSRALAERRQSGVAQLRIPIGPAPLGCEVEQIPLRVDGIDVARVLP
ncbi:MAG TPA: hypothetical protein VIY29_08130, partial [Ktedonobacteraceae bacterium]